MVRKKNVLRNIAIVYLIIGLLLGAVAVYNENRANPESYTGFTDTFTKNIGQFGFVAVTWPFAILNSVTFEVFPSG